MSHPSYVDGSPLSVHDQWPTFARWAVDCCTRVVNWQPWPIYKLSLLLGQALAEVVSRLLAGIVESLLVFVGF